MRFLLFLLLSLCGISAVETKLKVAVSIEPQAFFVKKIGGDLVETFVLVPHHKNPEHYEPLISQMKSLKDVRIFFGIGLEFEEKWKKRFLSANTKMDFIDLSHQRNQVFNQREDNHIWLSLVLAREQAKEISENLIKQDSNHQAIYQKNLEIFLQEIDALDLKIKNLFKQNGVQKTFVVYHPAFEFFAKEYGLEELAVDVHNKEAKIKHLQELSKMIEQKKLKVIYMQPQFSKKQIQTLAKNHHLKISMLDPFAYDWLENLWDIAQKIAYER